MNKDPEINGPSVPNNLLDNFMWGMALSTDQVKGWRPIHSSWTGQRPTILNLGAGNKRFHNTISLDRSTPWNAETIDCLQDFRSESVDGILAYHFLEHVRNIVPLMRECQRVLRVGGRMNIVVPYYMGGMAYQDLDHVNFFTEDTWRNLFSNEYYGDWGRWKFQINANLVMGTSARTLALVTQLEKQS